MPVHQTSIAGLLVVRWNIRTDERGFFKHSYQARELENAIGRELRLRQGNHSRSKARVLRGFHTEPWDKLLYVVRGTATCAVADPRPASATFGKAETFLLGDAPGEHARLFVSQGLANAFYCQSETDYLNDVSQEFDPANRGGLAWDDETIAVEWLDRNPILSEVDSHQPRLSTLFPDHPIFKK